MSAVQTSGLTFESIPQDEHLTGEALHTGDVLGFVVVLTKFGQGKVRDVALYEGADSFGDAVRMLHDVRSVVDAEHYARMDAIYPNGNRIIR